MTPERVGQLKYLERRKVAEDPRGAIPGRRGSSGAKGDAALRVCVCAAGRAITSGMTISTRLQRICPRQPVQPTYCASHAFTHKASLLSGIKETKERLCLRLDRHNGYYNSPVLSPGPCVCSASEAAFSRNVSVQMTAGPLQMKN
ncbi:hypothetical protein Bbelb_204350 [Branchiostoma belcheri]|nr:hypothetical protein Bbelb_204350 [Branchiostoma belcheri]